MLLISKVSLILLSNFLGIQCLSLSHLTATRCQGLMTRGRQCNHLHKAEFSYRTALYSTPDANNQGTTTVSIKLPIIQVFKMKEITGEFVCGNQLGTSIENFQSLLVDLEKDIHSDSRPFNYGVSNIYSEDQLENILSSSEDYVVLKIFRVGCKKCETLEPIFEDLSRDPVYSKFQFLQADVTYIDTYKDKLKERLMSRSKDNDVVQHILEVDMPSLYTDDDASIGVQ
jgi:thiol-disulfide isomerase/thioredoxin